MILFIHNLSFPVCNTCAHKFGFLLMILYIWIIESVDPSSVKDKGLFLLENRQVILKMCLMQDVQCHIEVSIHKLYFIGTSCTVAIES